MVGGEGHRPTPCERTPARSRIGTARVGSFAWRGFLKAPHSPPASLGYSVQLLLKRRSDMTFENLLRSLRAAEQLSPRPSTSSRGITAQRAAGRPELAD